MYFEDAMDDGDVSVFDLEHHNLSYTDGCVLVVEKQDVASLEGRLHRTTAAQQAKGTPQPSREMSTHARCAPTNR